MKKSTIKKLTIISGRWCGFLAVSLILTFINSSIVPVQAGLPGAVLLPRTDSEQTSEKVADSRQSAITAISGSPFPGIVDHLMQYPLNDNDLSDFTIHINYPSIGNPKIDADIRTWVGELAEAFKTHYDASQVADLPLDLDMQIENFLHDDDLLTQSAADSLPAPIELYGNYTVSRPSDAAISLTFEIWNHAGNPQGNLDILTLNYNLLNHRRLGLVDMFENPDIALKLMSSWARKQLGPRLEAIGGAQMLIDGTMPLEENFSSLTLTRDGIRINFQPFQVAPWKAGLQAVEMPLEELSGAGPLLSLWGK